MVKWVLDQPEPRHREGSNEEILHDRILDKMWQAANGCGDPKDKDRISYRPQYECLKHGPLWISPYNWRYWSRQYFQDVTLISGNTAMQFVDRPSENEAYAHDVVELFKINEAKELFEAQRRAGEAEANMRIAAEDTKRIKQEKTMLMLRRSGRRSKIIEVSRC